MVVSSRYFGVESTFGKNGTSVLNGLEPDEIIEAVRNGEAREVLAAANETMAAQLKEETDKLLDSVLYTTSMNMKNGFHMSDF